MNALSPRHHRRVEFTQAPGRHVVLYDGQCRFCRAGANQFVRLVGDLTVDLLDFQKPGVLEQFPGIRHEDCMREMQFVTPDGRVFRGAAAVTRALATRRGLGWVTAFYEAPFIRELADLTYAMIAEHRYRLMGKAVANGECSEGTCALHFSR